MESHLTLCSLHKGQTSQDNFAGATAALGALIDICESPGHSWCQGRPAVEDGLNFLPQTGRENNSPWSLAQGMPATWLFSGGTRCQLSIWGISSQLWISGNFFAGEGALPPLNPHCKRYPPFETPPTLPEGGRGRAKNGPLSSESFQNGQETKRSGVKACLPLPKVIFGCKGQGLMDLEDARA